MPASNELSDREQEILRLVATGASNKEIAQTLTISSNTVKVHIRNIYSKIGVSSRTEAALYAVNAGLMPGIRVNQSFLEVDQQDGDVSISQVEGVSQSIIGDEIEKKRNQKWIITGFLLAIVVMITGIVVFLNWRNPAKNNSAFLPGSAVTRWKNLSSMPTARSRLAVATFENQIYAIAGETEQGVSNVVERYNPISDMWERLSDKPTPVSDVHAEVIGGKIYIPGGRLESGLMSKVLEVYDPRINAWSQGNPMPEGISGYALAAYEGRLYLFGGKSDDAFSSSTYTYDPIQDVWAEKSSMPTARVFGGAVQTGGKIYVIGGFDGKNILQSNEIYTPEEDDGAGNPWIGGPELPESRYGMGMAGVVDYILVLGGIGTQEGSNKSYEYFTQSGQWQAFGEAEIKSWAYPGVVPLGTSLFIIGGEVDGVPTDSNLSYQAIYIINMPLINR